MNFALFLLQLAVILAASRLVGAIVRRIHQPRVIGEIIAGLLLGPSFLGWIAPSLSAALFPKESLLLLNLASQLGLVLFMFLVGLRLELEHLRKERAVAVVASAASIVAPFLLSVALGYFLQPYFAGPGVGTLPFVLFIGAAISVTAFPVLARILTEQNLFDTRLGAIAISCAAVDDISAWTILAAIVSLVKQEHSLTATLGTFAVYLVAMIFVVRPLLRRMPGSDENIRAGALLLLLISAAATEVIGFHALFGAFFAGVIFPQKNHQIDRFADSMEPVVSSLLLPIFFAFTGLRTNLGLIRDPQLWGWTAAILAVAIGGKVGGAWFAARWMGLPGREAYALGILMNTRGLVGLVILNVGMDLGILTSSLFAILVLVAVITTFMTSPWVKYVLKDSPPVHAS
jgi:Kef-type K+ transport system membrane component KefB